MTDKATDKRVADGCDQSDTSQHRSRVLSVTIKPVLFTRLAGRSVRLRRKGGRREKRSVPSAVRVNNIIVNCTFLVSVPAEENCTERTQNANLRRTCCDVQNEFETDVTETIVDHGRTGPTTGNTSCTKEDPVYAKRPFELDESGYTVCSYCRVSCMNMTGFANGLSARTESIPPGPAAGGPLVSLVPPQPVVSPTEVPHVAPIRAVTPVTAPPGVHNRCSGSLQSSPPGVSAVPASIGPLSPRVSAAPHVVSQLTDHVPPWLGSIRDTAPPALYPQLPPSYPWVENVCDEAPHSVVAPANELHQRPPLNNIRTDPYFAVEEGRNVCDQKVTHGVHQAPSVQFHSTLTIGYGSPLSF